MPNQPKKKLQEKPKLTRRKRLWKWLRRLLGVALVSVILLISIVTYTLRSSLPLLDGDVTVKGLNSNVTIERDNLGVPTVTATNRLEATFGLGFVHAQDRFFQMDLLRRYAAGELGELFGKGAVNNFDKSTRPRRLRHVSQQTLKRLNVDEKRLLEAYTNGVNAGIENLGSRPPEYWLIGSKPKNWMPEDSLLVLHAMSLSLVIGNGDEAALERRVAAAKSFLHPDAYNFFYPLGTDWDSALDSSLLPAAEVPGPELIDFRQDWPAVDVVATGAPSRATWERCIDTSCLGSNAWAIDGTMTSTGSAMLASDMHLDGRMPNHWYRARITWMDGDANHDVIGVTIPGMPVVPAGSNGKVAWCCTFTNLDIADSIIIETDNENPNRYRTPEGWREFERHTERIGVKGESSPFELEVAETTWGPILGENSDGSLRAEKYLFQDPAAMNFRLGDLTVAANVAEAMQTVTKTGTFVLNIVLADSAGDVGWSVTGPLPRRRGAAGKTPNSWADGTNGWDGYLAPQEHPRVASPESRYVYSANNRKLGTPDYLALCRSNAMFGARAKQIRSSLESLSDATSADMLAIQLDDRAIVLQRWKTVLLETLATPTAAKEIGAVQQGIERHVSEWNGRATADSVAYRLIRAFRIATILNLYEPLTDRIQQLAAIEEDDGFEIWEGAEQPAWKLLNERPKHLLNPRFQDYDALLLDSVRSVVNEFRKDGVELEDATWGRLVNQPFKHPLSVALPVLSDLLDVRTDGVHGGDYTPRVNSLNSIVSERLVVTPGREEEGIFHMPGGQSGHFLSPYYRAGHEAWVEGTATSLLPGKTAHTLTIQPRIE